MLQFCPYLINIFIIVRLIFPYQKIHRYMFIVSDIGKGIRVCYQQKSAPMTLSRMSLNDNRTLDPRSGIKCSFTQGVISIQEIQGKIGFTFCKCTFMLFIGSYDITSI